MHPTLEQLQGDSVIGRQFDSVLMLYLALDMDVGAKLPMLFQYIFCDSQPDAPVRPLYYSREAGTAVRAMNVNTQGLVSIEGVGHDFADRWQERGHPALHLVEQAGQEVVVFSDECGVKLRPATQRAYLDACFLGCLLPGRAHAKGNEGSLLVQPEAMLVPLEQTCRLDNGKGSGLFHSCILSQNERACNLLRNSGTIEMEG